MKKILFLTVAFLTIFMGISKIYAADVSITFGVDSKNSIFPIEDSSTKEKSISIGINLSYSGISSVKSIKGYFQYDKSIFNCIGNFGYDSSGHRVFNCKDDNFINESVRSINQGSLNFVSFSIKKDIPKTGTTKITFIPTEVIDNQGNLIKVNSATVIFNLSPSIHIPPSSPNPTPKPNPAPKPNPTPAPIKSSNNDLKTLSVKDYKLDKEFNKTTLSYKITIPNNIEKIVVNATKDDQKSSINITGNKNLKIGDNTVKITVTAENGNKKEYKITVTRESSNNAFLKSLEVEGHSLNGVFNKDELKYNLIVDNSITSINILAETEDENATIEIKKDGELIVGINTVSVIVTAENKDTKEYNISVTRKPLEKTIDKNHDEKPENDKPNILLYIAIPSVISIGVGVYIIIQKRKKYLKRLDE